MEKQRPVQVLKLGRIRASIWANSSKEKTQDVWFSVQVSRLYKDNGDWKDSTSFRRDDLPIVSKILEMAYAWIWNRQSTDDGVECS